MTTNHIINPMIKPSPLIPDQINQKAEKNFKNEKRLSKLTKNIVY